MLTNITSLSCLDNDGATTPLQTFNQNPNLPPGITVGRVNNTDIFCLGDDTDEDVEGAGQVCYSNIPGVHRALSNFNLNDYKKPDIDEVKKEEVPSFTIEDMDKLVPGMWLKCLYDTDDTKLYEAMYLTSDANQMSPNVEGINTPNTIGIEYHRDELDKGDDAQKIVPISWCMPYGYNVYETDNNVEYMVENNAEELFHRVFNELSNKQSLGGGDEKVLFSNSMYEGTVAKDDDGYLKIGWGLKPLPAELDTSSYSTIYSALPISHPEIQQLDNKFKLYQLYNDDPLASTVFPKSYSSYKEALQDTEEAGDGIFYIKKAGATRGEGIYVKTRDELAKDYKQLEKEGEYDVEKGEGDIIIQRAVTDLYTVDGDGPISGARFDVRYYVLIIDGKVYLHSTMVFSWPLGLKYNPNDTDVENQVIKSYFKTHDIIRTKSIEAPLKDEDGNKWNNSQRKRRRSSATSSSDEFKKADVHGWRDAVADALDDASGVFENLKEITRDDPTKYVLAGGDAMIKEDGSAVIIEFNVWSDMSVSVPYSSLDKCESGCTGLFIQTADSADNYIVTEPTAASHIISAYGNFEVVRDVVSMVMKVQPADEIERWREIVVRDGDE